MSEYNNLPQELQETGKFNCWRYEPNPQKPDKPKKVPYNVLTGGRGDSTNPDTFTDFPSALAAVSAYDGMGVGVFDSLAVIDLDGCVEDKGISSSVAQDIVAIMDAYTEISPSGTGLRIICKASGFVFDKRLYYIHNQRLGVEIYVAGATSKFLTVTGDVICEAGLEERGEQLDTVLTEYMLRPAPLDLSAVKSEPYLTDEEILQKAPCASNGDKFGRLWGGDTTGYTSLSDADFALMGILAFWCGKEPEQMERLFSMSALGQRGKWGRDDYRRITIANSIAGCKTIYKPDYNKTSAAADFAGGLPGSAASLIKPAVEVKSRDVPWAIEGLLIRGALTGIQGLPDSGKSFFTCALAVAKANGGEFPQADGAMVRLSPGRVLIANFDDALEFGIMPRLEKLGLTAEGASRITFLDPSAAAGVTFDDPRLAAVFDEVKPEIAIFDTLQHFIGGKVDLHRANETNAAMAQLKVLAEKYDTAVVIIQHISKNAAGGNGGASVLWGLGSTAINGLFRSVWTVGKVKGEDESLRAAVSSKNNLLPYIPPALQYSLSQGEGFRWRGVSREVTARDLIRGDGEKNTRGRPAEQRDVAAEFIEDTLAFGKVRASIIYDKANLLGLSERTLKRAKTRLGVRTVKEGKEWYWDIPAAAAENIKGDNIP